MKKQGSKKIIIVGNNLKASKNTQKEKTSKASKEVETNLLQIHINQLHNATINFSNSCLTIKKLFIVTVTAVITTFLTLGNTSYSLLCLLCFIISILFLIQDSCFYFYQKKLRYRMSLKENQVYKINGIESAAEEQPQASKFKAVFNFSNFIYFIVMRTSLLLLMFTVFLKICCFICNS